MTYETLISTEALAANLQAPGWLVFDCRHQLSDPQAGRRAYTEAHIPGARFAHLDEDLAGPVRAGTGRHPLPEPRSFVAWLRNQGLSRDSQVVVYDDAGGAMAARLWWMLRLLGHRAVAVLDGGWPQWVAEQRPVTADVPAREPGDFVPREEEALVVTTWDVEELLGCDDVALLDARGAARYAGETEPIDPVAGHIPGALNLPFADNLTAQGTFRDAQALRERFTAALGNGRRDVIHYCGSGVSACHNILAMAVAGLPEGRLYVGSWSQWCADPQRPVQTGRATPS